MKIWESKHCRYDEENTERESVHKVGECVVLFRRAASGCFSLFVLLFIS